jgi:hypothetical protein
MLLLILFCTCRWLVLCAQAKSVQGVHSTVTCCRHRPAVSSFLVVLSISVQTECTKQCLQYIAEIAGSSSQVGPEERLLMSNPILEAFGNAKVRHATLHAASRSSLCIVLIDC